MRNTNCRYVSSHINTLFELKCHNSLNFKFCFSFLLGIRHWNRPNNAATGQSVTLYERHPHTAEHAGNPIADTFALVARKNSAIIVLGDGVNWGAKPALASRCAVRLLSFIVETSLMI
jgi:fructoselysine-6-P-deglycase FrlB-like protein